MRLRTYSGRSASSTTSADGSNSYSGIGLVLVRLTRVLDDLEREHPDDPRRLGDHVHEVRVDHVELPDAAVGRVGEEGLQQGRGRSRAATSADGESENPVHVPESSRCRKVKYDTAASTGHVQVDVGPVVVELLHQPLALAQHGRRVGARHAAVGRDEQHGGAPALGPLARERVVDLGVADDRRHRAGDRAGVRAGGRDARLAFPMRDAAISSIARKIFLSAWVDLIRSR